MKPLRESALRTLPVGGGELVVTMLMVLLVQLGLPLLLMGGEKD